MYTCRCSFLVNSWELRGLLQNRETGNPRKIAGEGAGKSAAKIRGAGGAGEGAARGVFRGKESGAAPLPALPPAPRIFAALFPLFPAPSPAIFWGSPFLCSQTVAGHAVPNPCRFHPFCKHPRGLPNFPGSKCRKSTTSSPLLGRTLTVTL